MHKRSKILDSLIHGVSLLSEAEKKELLKVLKGEDSVPVSIFYNDLPALQALVSYLKKYQKKMVREIAFLLKRKPSTIYNTLRGLSQNLDTSSSVKIDLSLFSNRKFSVLEIVVSHLRDNEHLSFVKIGEMLHRSPSTVKTTYRRFREK